VSNDLGTWLRAQREQRGWTRNHLARQLITAARDAGDRTVPDAGTISGYIYRWETGGVREVSERYRHAYCRVLGITLAEFGPPADAQPGTPGTEVALVPGLPSRADVAYGERREPETRQSIVMNEVLMAAHEGSDHAARAEQRGIGDTTLEQLRADLARLARLSDTGEPFTVFQDLRRVRDRVHQLLERRLWPREQSDLYFILSCLNGLMGLAAARLGYPDSAEELIRSGFAYATVIDHRPLLAELRLQLSDVSYGRGMTLRSRDLAADGLRYLDAGSAGADLHLKFARAAARLGDAGAARRAVAAAHEARGRDHHDELVEMGGEFAVSTASYHYFAGAALSEISGGAEPAAAEEIETAVALYEAGPGPGEQHYFGARARAGIDLAAIRLRAGALDAAETAIAPVLALPQGQRVSYLGEKMPLIRVELAGPRYQGSAQARDLDERIEDFIRDTMAAGLNGLPSGLG
jgi:transcriptional regulator with XRE-family HTH domain